jgi:hypothetical protein
LLPRWPCHAAAPPMFRFRPYLLRLLSFTPFDTDAASMMSFPIYAVTPLAAFSIIIFAIFDYIFAIFRYR